MTDQLRVDLEALTRLSPTVADLARQLQMTANRKKTAPSTMGTPTFQAAGTFDGQTLPGIVEMVAGRFTEVANLAVQAGRSFANLDEPFLTNLVSSAPSLLAGGPSASQGG